MKTDIFNTDFEFALRVIIILGVYSKPISLERILYSDFICSYAKTFGVGNTNLHGNNRFSFNELAVRRLHIQNAIKDLVLNRYIDAKMMKSGTKYKVNSRGLCLKEKMKDDYSNYLIEITSVLVNYTESQIEKIVLNKVEEMK